MIIDGSQRPGDDESSNTVSRSRGKCKAGSTNLRGEAEGGQRSSVTRRIYFCNWNSQDEKYTDLSPNPILMLSRINTKRLKRGQDADNEDPRIPHREWQMDKQLICHRLGG